MMNQDLRERLRQPVREQRQFDRGAVRPPRVIDTAAADQPVRAVPMSIPRIGRNDADRADRLREWMNRNRDVRNRGGGITGAPAPNVDNDAGAATTPAAGEVETRRHSGDRNRGGDRRDGENREWNGNHRHGGDRQWDRNHRHGGNRHREWHERHRDDPNFERNHRRWHNREWWRRNYTRFALFGGGYYYWNSGYWYPAYGYHPRYSTYSYDAPLYGYNGLPPGQVIAMAQTQLQQRGYYDAAVDGTYGRRTEQALLNFQADAGIPMTGEIDRETLLALGYR